MGPIVGLRRMYRQSCRLQRIFARPSGVTCQRSAFARNKRIEKQRSCMRGGLSSRCIKSHRRTSYSSTTTALLAVRQSQMLPEEARGVEKGWRGPDVENPAQI
jgi:hypothetical protein